LVASGLAIRQKTQASQLEILKEMVRALNMNPEQVLTREALSQGATTYKTTNDLENHQLQILSSELKQLIRMEASV
jgi:hypothetical protein